jgi:probable phosphoglycerate mutase
LDERGQTEAQSTGRWLAQRLDHRQVPLIASPVRRAWQTAEVIAEAFKPPLTIRPENGIAETHVPDWQGQLADDIMANDPRWQEFYKGPADFRFPGGETGREVQARAVAAVEKLCREFEYGELILVSHAEPIRGIIAHYLGMNVNLYYRLRISCGSISCLSLPGQESNQRRPKAQLDFLNQTEHLS